MSLLPRAVIFRNLNLHSRTIQHTRTFLTKKKCPQKPEEESKCGATASGGTGGAGDIPIGYQLLKNTQAKFQQKDNLPVWLKGGPMDRMLYLSTVGLAIFGLGWSVVFISTMILK